MDHFFKSVIQRRCVADCPGIEGKPEAIRQNLEEKEEEAEET